jgi:hypothetical protein
MRGLATVLGALSCDRGKGVEEGRGLGSFFFLGPLSDFLSSAFFWVSSGRVVALPSLGMGTLARWGADLGVALCLNSRAWREDEDAQCLEPLLHVKS